MEDGALLATDNRHLVETAPYSPLDADVILRDGLAGIADLPRLLASGNMDERKLVMQAFIAGATVRPDEARLDLLVRPLPVIGTADSTVRPVARAPYLGCPRAGSACQRDEDGGDPGRIPWHRTCRHPGVHRLRRGDVATVPDQLLQAAPDVRLADVCRSEDRCLVTLDLGFADSVHFVPTRFAGIVVLRLPAWVTPLDLDAACRSV